MSRCGAWVPSSSDTRHWSGVGRGRSGEHIEVVCGPRRHLHSVAGEGAQVVEEFTETVHLVAIGVALSGGPGPRPGEAIAGATGLSRTGGVSSVKVRGASASRRCQTT